MLNLCPSKNCAKSLLSISVLQIAWIFLNCTLCAALINANNLLVPAASTVSCVGASCAATAMGTVFERGGLGGSLILAMVSSHNGRSHTAIQAVGDEPAELENNGVPGDRLMLSLRTAALRYLMFGVMAIKHHDPCAFSVG